MQPTGGVFELTPVLGFLLASVTSGSLVLGMYASAAARRRNYKRDDPANIRDRAFWALAATLFSCLLAAAAAPAAGAVVPVRERLGLGAPVEVHILSAAASVVYVTTLFAGVIAAKWFDGELNVADQVSALRRAAGDTGAAELSQRRWVALRNYVIGPVAEEVIFRACCCYFLFFGGAVGGAGLCMTVSAFLFALAHVHHLFRMITADGRSMAEGLAMVAGGLIVHSVFALFSTFLYIRTGSLTAAVIAHSYCNWLGPPHGEFLDSSRPSMERCIIGFCYALGVVSFYLLCGPLTDPSVFASPFYRASAGG
eukprot:TRINITY_DN10778_c0_g1_i1.p1 TRINITY_DN10778_c0_g1~~TRINITY_DN10778_c0_g1_i1.p1  ORF type:complete len:342 (+),score=70.35 TRINITY_DN10778_c0_g1_i1:95-1027(+)